MPKISIKKKKFIKKNFNRLSIEEIALKTGLKTNVIRSLIDEYSRKDQGSSVKLISKESLFTRRSVKVTYILAFFVFIITLLVYFPALKNDFVNWDDNNYIYENINIRFLNLQSLSWMLTSFHASNWHPLTWFSHAIDYAFWNLNPLGHHLTNIILHSFNALLVFLLVMRLMMKAKETNMMQFASKRSLPSSTQFWIVAGVTALLFGVHPLHVESVAWVSERKDLLCAFFFLLTLLSYLSYTSSISKKHRWMLFTTSLLLFMCALMSKPMAVSLPVILLLLDIYPLKRIDLYPPKTGKSLSVLLEKIPFFALSIASCTITIIAQYTGEAIRSFERFPIDVRLLNAIRSLIFYLEKIIVPFNLLPLYPFPSDLNWFELPYFLSSLLVVTITGFCVWKMQKGEFLFFTIWSYYLVTLLPVIGIVQVGSQSAADRYTYLPSLGIFLLIGIGISWIFERGVLKKHKNISKGLVVIFISAILFLLGQLTIKQIEIWRNSESLWSYVNSASSKKSQKVHVNLGNVYNNKSMFDEAISEYKKALNIDPNYVLAHYNLGLAYFRKKMSDEAISEFKKAIAIKPDYANAHHSLGISYYNQGKTDEAISEYMKAIAIKPDYADAYHSLGISYYKQGKTDEAISEYKKALNIDPNYVKAHYNLGLAYFRKRMSDEAISEFKKAIAIKPDYANAHHELAFAYYSKGNYKLAIVHCDKAVKLGYNVKPKLLELLKPYR